MSETVTPLWGCYVQVGDIWVWEPNRNLVMTEDEQLEANYRNDQDFRFAIKRPRTTVVFE